MKDRIYLDNNATTKLDPRVLEEMLIDLKGPPANPSSIHYFGQRAKKLLTDARRKVADYFSVKSHEVIFTSGGTESNNMAILSFAKTIKEGHILSTNIEHSCIHNSLLDLQSKGVDVRFLQAGKRGCITPEMLQEAINESTRLIICSAVNSETGIKTDLDDIAIIAHSHQIPLIVDGVALLGKEEIKKIPDGISAISFSSHKLHGPKGIGLLLVPSPNKIFPLFQGGSQELQRRPGTENLAGILGFAKAIDLLNKELPKATKRMAKLRDLLETLLKEKCKKIFINGEGARICNTSNICFKGIDGESLLILLDQAKIAASLGSACSSGAIEPSRILTNMGIKREFAKSSLRFSLSRFTTEDEIFRAAHQIEKIVKSLS